MYQSGPLRVLGQIAAMNTFIENFPMSILDLSHGPTYTSIFEFLIDVLEACGIQIYDIVNRLLEKVFGFNGEIQGGVESISAAIGKMGIDEQSEFFQVLEYGVKGIIMALLSSIFSCSAIPILPTKNMDISIPETMRFRNDFIDYIISNENSLFIPYGVLNMFGALNASPFSNEGRMLYEVEGGDKYFQKVNRTKVIEQDAITIDVPKYEKFSQLFLMFGPGHADYVASKDLSAQDEIIFRLSHQLSADLIIDVSYIGLDNERHVPRFRIPAGKLESELFLATPVDKVGNETEIEYIRIFRGGDFYNEDDQTATVAGDTYCYLSENMSNNVIRFWQEEGNTSFKNVKWGKPSMETVSEEISDAETLEVEMYEYTEVGHEIPDAIRVSSVENADSESPDYVVCYQGLDPNTLYKTDDMNAFLWYVYNRGGEIPQSEFNKSMWDSRISAKNLGTERHGPDEWNQWYNAKANETGVLRLNGDDNNDLFPIIQLKRAYDGFDIKFPAQTYFKPRHTRYNSDIEYLIGLNSSLYKFNYDYLSNIKIFHPKVILYGMFDALLNGAISALLGIKIDFSVTEINAKLSNAIKKYIEAEDTEVEDCYFTFSNEEFDSMLNDMILARFGATYSGGEEHRATQHDIHAYINQIDSVSFSASAAGTTSKITKIVSDISVDRGHEGAIEYGVTLGYDKSIFKKILWAMAIPIIKSIFTPQLIMLFLINFQLMGITSLEDLFGTNQSAIIKLLTNKIFALIRSIISFIKDKLCEILFAYFQEVILPVIIKAKLLELREKMEDWITLLTSAMLCLPRFRFAIRHYTSEIDSVDYADIVNEQKLPENTGGC